MQWKHSISRVSKSSLYADLMIGKKCASRPAAFIFYQRSRIASYASTGTATIKMSVCPSVCLSVCPSVHHIVLLYQNKQEAQLLLGDRAARKHAKDCWNGRGNDNLGWNELQMYFKVIKSGTNRKLVYDFLLVVYSNFCRITYRFWEIWCETVQWPWNMPKSLTVVSPESCRVAMYVKCL